MLRLIVSIDFDGYITPQELRDGEQNVTGFFEAFGEALVTNLI